MYSIVAAACMSMTHLAVCRSADPSRSGICALWSASYCDQAKHVVEVSIKHAIKSRRDQDDVQ